MDLLQTLIPLVLGFVLASLKDVFFDVQAKRRARRKALLYLLQVWKDLGLFERRRIISEAYLAALREKFPNQSETTLLSISSVMKSFIDIWQLNRSDPTDDENEKALYSENLSRIAEDDPLLAFELENRVMALDYLASLHETAKQIVPQDAWHQVSDLITTLSSPDFVSQFAGLQENIITLAGKIGPLTKRKTKRLVLQKTEDLETEAKDKSLEIVNAVVEQMARQNGA